MDRYVCVAGGRGIEWLEWKCGRVGRSGVVAWLGFLDEGMGCGEGRSAGGSRYLLNGGRLPFRRGGDCEMGESGGSVVSVCSLWREEWAYGVFHLEVGGEVLLCVLEHGFCSGGWEWAGRGCCGCWCWVDRCVVRRRGECCCWAGEGRGRVGYVGLMAWWLYGDGVGG